MFADRQEQRIALVVTSFIAVGVIGISLFAFGLYHRVVVKPISKPVNESDAIAALLKMGAIIHMDLSGSYAEQVTVFQEFLIGENGYHQFSDADMRYIAALHHLRELHIIETGITNHSLSSLNNLPHIRHLTLRNYNLTDDAVPFICKLSRLEFLNVRQTEISASGLEILQKHFPDLEIRFDERITQR